ncbi:amino acid adenylation domain-containing protein [Nocardia sp. NBC_00565]|uniref:non-ribosomal peptide synthetase n=1 Tax=Nocardia sp. NBC_00565 TaxID=2975993 RepID=UPI002E801AC5|nr:amino acid adenylation domain-containing protein [Nocardia sp. NBC_00565]WUC02778.1 amino acid adenylation domain-containing protein [Nocardia sp. NBC_00565]
MTRPARTRPVRTRQPRVTSLPQLMGTAVEANPDGIAVVFADATASIGQLTYAELDDRSTRLARLLIERGVGPEDLVAVGIPRSLDSVVAVWAVAKTGAGFVPVDPNYPAERVAHMVTDSGAVLGLAVAEVATDLPDQVEWLVIDALELALRLEEYSGEPITYMDRVRAVRAENPAYVIYTSGSTGKPKGVVVTQAGLAGFCDEQRERYRVTNHSRTLHFASPSFDASVLELLLALGGAATMVVVAPNIFGGDELAALLRRERVTHAFITPAALASVDPTGLDDFRVVVAGGEACPPDLVRRWVLPIADGRTREFCNGYGPTETTIMTNISSPMTPGETVTIGGPIRAITEYVLDDRLNRVPSGVIGELYISGAQVARGYHDRPALTASRFVANPFDPSGSRLYATGDLARWTTAGEIEYMGRNDFQVKIRGFRIELGEVDAVLGAHDSVDFAVTIGHELDTGATILASYVHAAGDAEVDTEALTAFAERSLPAHMVPTVITVLDTIPLTPVGKLDRSALPAPVLETKQYRVPETEVEQVIAEVLGEVLGIDRIGLDDDFFALGGDSITSIQVVSRARARGVIFTPRDVFEMRTVAALASLATVAAPAPPGELPTGPLVELSQADTDRLATEYPKLAEVWPLTPLQSGMLFHAQLAESSVDAYMTQFMVDLGGDVDPQRLHAAAVAVVGRHVNLRVAFAVDADGNPVQVVLDEVEVPWRAIDLTHLGQTEAAAELQRVMAADLADHFDMRAAPLLRFALIRSVADAYHLLVTSHHILIDGWSMPLLTQDLLTLYVLGGDATQLPPARSYRDYLAWLGTQDHSAARDAWREVLAGITEPTPLAGVDPAREISAGVGEIGFELTEDDTKALTRLAADAGVTVNTVIQAAWGLLIGRSVDRDDVVFGATVSGRPPQLDGIETMVGLFLNAIPVRVRLDANDTLAGLLRQLQSEQAALLDHHYVGLSEIQEIVGVDGLFDTLVVFESFPVDEKALTAAASALDGMSITGAVAVNGTHYPVTVVVVPDIRMHVTLKYLRDLFDETAAQALAQRFSTLIGRFIADPLAKIAEVDALTEVDRAVLDAVNATEVPELLDDSTLLTLFDAQVARTPEAPALIFGDTIVSYAELDTRSRQLARDLIHRGVGVESAVAVAMRRGIEMVVAIYGVLRAGGAYVPIDPDHPAERNEYVLASAAPVGVLTTTGTGFETATDTPLVYVDGPNSAAALIFEDLLSGTGTVAAPHPDNTAYVIYTSGSTGRPKGVAITHRQMANQFRWAQRTYPHGPGDVVLHKTPITFDISTWELIWTLQTGAAVVVAEPDGHRDPAYLARVIDEYRVSTVHFVPSMLDAFLDGMPAAAAYPSLRRVFAAGEALSADTAARFTTFLPNADLHNWYGPAEATVVTAYPAEPRGRVAIPIGTTVANTRVHVLDRQLRPVPIGAVGELYVAGVQLARGYVNAPALTAERFVAHVDGQRLYRTGDVVRWVPGRGDYALEYLGRSDFQVKLRGQRVELGEIETVLLGVDAVQRAAVALVNGSTGDRLVAYVVAAPGAQIDEDVLLDDARAALPSYMVPSAIVRLDALPLNASGKLDRKALPAPEFIGRPYREPSTPLERIVAEVFVEVLGIERVGADDDFFDLGGNSLVATRVVARLGTAIGSRVPVRAVFEAPTVAGLAAAVAPSAGQRREVPLVAGPRPERIPLSLAQQRMWFLNQFDTESAVNNLPVAVRLTGALDIAALQQAVADLVERHETLRTVYPADRDGVAHQVIVPAAQAVPDLTPQPVTADALRAKVVEIVAAGFDVTDQVPLRGALFQVAEPGGPADEYVLVFVAHHISADGWSMGPMTRDLMLAYVARAAGVLPAWQPLPVQYADFSLWQREVLGSEDDPDSLITAQTKFWRTALAGLPDELNLPADRPRPMTQSFAGGTVGCTVDPGVHRRLQEIGREQNATIFMVVHSALAVFLARLSGTDDIAVGTPVAGRGAAELDDVIGMFVNTLVLRTPVRGGASFTELLSVVKDADLQAFAYADIPFERLVERLNPVRSTARHPLFQVMLSFQNLPDNSFELPGLRVDGVELDIDTAKFDLSLALNEPAGSGGMNAEFSFARDLFDDTTVRRFADRFVGLLEQIAARPDAPVGDIDLLGDDERAAVLLRWNDTGRELLARRPEPGAVGFTVVDDFLAQVRATPGAVAIVDPASETSLTYAQFGSRVHRLARRLIEAGVGPEKLVALGLRRSVDLVVAVYAVQEAGGGYVPLDLDQPTERVSYVLESAAPVCVLTTSHDNFGSGGLPTLSIDELDLSGYSNEPVVDAERIGPLRPENAAYVIFTSGSTGRPKGVAVPHSAVVNQIRWITAEYGIGADDVVLFKTPATFDVSVWELFGPLSTGGRIVVASPDGHRDPQYLAEVIAAERVTMTSFVPSMLTVFAGSVEAAGGGTALASLRALLVAGEAFTGDAAAAIRRVSSAELYNLYGPTEFAVHATHSPVARDIAGAVPIGLPVWNAQAYVLDSRLHPVPSGVAGELYLAGAQLARGYFGRADLSADRFVANPFGMSERMYRTGDLVTRDADGSIVYLGRTDFQVKLRGLRIELGEVETALTAHDSVGQAVALVRSDARTGDQLVGYVVPAAGATVDTDELRTHLSARLPSYMVPAALMVLDVMPLNPNGKLDRRALPEPAFEAREFRAPNTHTEQIVASTFAAVLRIGTDADDDRYLGLDDDFFALGGNSLLATQLVARLGAALDTRVPVRVLFEASTVAELAAEVQQLAGTGDRLALTASERPEHIPLSLAQQRMWFLNRFDTDSSAYNIPIAVRLTGALDVAALRRAVADLVERHEILRTIYPQTDAGPAQLILPADAAAPKLEVREVQPSEIESAVVELTSTIFDVTSAVPVRVALFDIDTAGDRLQVARNDTADKEYVLAMVVHHISGDGSSVAPLTRDLMIAYAARSAGAAPSWSPLTVQYADYSIWQRELLGREDDPESLAAEQVAYWRSALADLPEQLDLPSDRPRPAAQTFAGGAVELHIAVETHRALIELARAEGATLFMVVHTALAVLLSRLSGTEDILIGTPMSGRGEAAVDDLIGMFVNTLVLRTRVAPAATFAELTARQRETDIQAFAHADVPFERLVEVLNPVRSTARHPLFQVGLSFQNQEQSSLELPGLTIAGVGIDTQVAQFDLNLIVGDAYDEHGVPAGIAGQFVYAKDLFDHATVDGFAARFVRLLGEIIAAPRTPVGEFDLLAPVERTRILLDWNDTDHPVAPELLLDAYRRAVAEHPDAVAVAYEGAELTYREFDQRVNRLARRLIEQGVGSEALVGLAIRRSLDLVVGMYAIVAAGGAYVPLDPDHPAERIAHILDTAQPACVLTTTADAVAVPGDTAVLHLDMLALDDFDDTPVRSDELLRPVRPENPAYVIFTSGSTGRPKGVAISHAAIHNQTTWMLQEYPLGLGDVYLQKTATTFDVSLWGYFMPLRTGAKLVVATHDGHRDPTYVAETIAAQGVTVTDFVPSMLTVFAAHTTAGSCPTLRDIFVIGEALPPETVDAVCAISDAQVHNLYGPTEAAVSVTYWAARGNACSGVPVGLPQWNTQVYVLDARLRPVPAGVAGELYLAGDQLARGYVRRPDLTSDRFVANPFGDGLRMYRTGDLVVWRESASGGVLDYIGRTDFQVKFRGQRIELGEIETALLAQPSVSQSVATVLPSALGDQLVAYAVPTPGYEIDQAELLAAVAETLPAYMIPAAIVALDSFPLNTSGKLDRKALPEPTFAGREFRAPATPVEQIVAGVFADVLGIDRVGVDDDFFALGGNSLIATQVVARLGAAIGGRVPVRTLFEVSTVGALAVKIEQHAGSGGRRALTAGPRPDRIPLSMAQQRMWFLNQLDPTSAVHNIPAAVRLTGALDLAALELAVTDLIERHEVLRTIYPQTDAGPVQLIVPAEQAVPDLTPVPVGANELPARVIATASAGFEVTTEVPVRAELFRVEHASDLRGTRNDTEHVLVLVAHHISADGWSMGPLTRDLMIAYASRSAGATPAWTPLPVQYADFSMWQREVLGSETDPDSLITAQANYWRDTLAGLPDELNLPTDRPRPTTQSFRGGRVVFPIGTELHRELQAVARAKGATMFMVVHTALAVLLARLSGTDDIAIGTPVAGRGEAELDDVIGMFVNTLVLRSEVSGQLSFDALLAHTKDADLQAFAHADIPFERLVDLLNPVRSTARHPLFQVMLSFQNLPDSTFELPGLRISAVDLEIDTAKFDLSLTIQEAARGAGMVAELSFARDLFDDATVRGFADRFAGLLERIVARPDVPVGDIDLLSDAERAAVRWQWNDTSRALGAVGTLVDEFARQAAATPDATAIVDPATGTSLAHPSPDHHPSSSRSATLTYAEFGAHVHRLARRLIEAGVGPEKLVALGLRRSVDLVVAAYAVHEAGGGYVPLDLDQPMQRIGYVLESAAPVCVLTTTGDDFDGGLPTLRINELDLSSYSDQPVVDAERITPLRPSNPAYVIFTSGSTGRPKGVAVPHSAVVNQIRWITGEYGIGADDVVLFKTPATFDVSVWELFGPLSTGGRIVVASPDGHRDPQYLAEVIAAERVTMTSFVPSMLTVFAGAVDSSALSSLRALLVAGEAFTAEAVRAIRKVSAAELYNLYGPTEFAVHATHRPVADEIEGAVPIGLPVWNAQAYVLDSRLHPVPPGVAGELYLAGAQLARGYAGRPDLTSDRFVADPFGTSERMYRTGDLVARNADGAIGYLGRTDFQVKLRGLRIELGEIETALTAHHSVAQAVALVRSDARTGDQLVGYVVPAAGAIVDSEELRSRLAEHLPSYMVPAAIVVLDLMPLNPNGKLDRRALPDPVFAAREFRAPSTPLEATVAGVFGDVIGVDQVGLDDDFFGLGANSLLAAQVVGRLRKLTGAEIKVAWFFIEPTVLGISKQIIAALEHGHDYESSSAAALGVILPIRAAGTRAPLFCVHPLAGLSWSYAGLARVLPADQPILGIQSPALAEDDYAPSSVADIVRRYVTEIRAVRPQGPYRLLGWSLGGKLAHAIATQLQADGAQVELLAILDAYPGGDVTDFRTQIRQVFIELGLDAAALPEAENLQELGDEALAALHAMVVDQGLDVLTPERLRLIYRTAMRTVELASEHRPPVFEGQLEFFSATVDAEARADRAPADWQPFVSGEIIDRPIRATHELMTSTEALDEIGPWLAELLETPERP